ncbi:hypothetical protein [uncultured Methylobacterium sp.]|uniref:hypothetical protein n=1 Tax=uncultured Methylobacterium sp. TaxID=157278 RepID=UPI0035CB49ED
MSEQLLKAAVRAEELQDIIRRKIEIRLGVGGLYVSVGDPAVRAHTNVITFLELQTYSANGLLADAIESCVRRGDQTLKSHES